MQKQFAPLVTRISTGILTSAIALCAAPAHAFTLSSSFGTWTDTEGGLYVGTYTADGENQVRWGYPADNPASVEYQSGLGFTGVGSTTFAAGEVFQLGRLRHFNNPIFGGTAASAASILISLVFADIGTQQFDFTLAIDETLNDGVCPYFSITPCSDKISWNHAFASNSFAVGSTNYTLQLLGFSNTPGGEIVSDFISQEGGTSEAYLFAQLIAVTPPPSSFPETPTAVESPPSPEAEAVPEPVTIAGSLLGLSFLLRYRQRKRIA